MKRFTALDKFNPKLFSKASKIKLNMGKDIQNNQTRPVIFISCEIDIP